MKGDAAPLELRDVTSGYGDVPVIRRASMTFRERLITTIVGSNGAGKSTAVKVAAGLLRAWQGSVSTYGTDITREPADRRVYRGIAYVPQGRIVVPGNDGAGQSHDRRPYPGQRPARHRSGDGAGAATVSGLKARMKQHADTMSGGEQQMLAIGRALMTSPKVIMLDEPSLGLSPKFVEIVFERLLSLRDEGMTVVMVEQKASHALGISDRGYVMHLGQVAYEGEARELLHERRRQAAVPRRDPGEPESAEFHRCMMLPTRSPATKRLSPSTKPSSPANPSAPSFRRPSSGPRSRNCSGSPAEAPAEVIFSPGASG